MRTMLNDAFAEWTRWVNLLHRFFADPFLRGFCGHFFLPTVLVLLLLLMFGKLGSRRFGIPRLFWHDNWAKQFFVGVALFWLYGNVVFVGYALERRPQAELVPNDEQVTQDGNPAGTTVQYRPRPPFAERVDLPRDWDPLAAYFFGITLSVWYVLLCLCVGVGFGMVFVVVLALVVHLFQIIIPGLGPPGTDHKPRLVAVLRMVILVLAVGVVFVLLTQQPLRPLLLLIGILLFLVLSPPLVVILFRSAAGPDAPHHDETPKLVWLFITGIPGIFILQSGALLFIHGERRTAMILFGVAAIILGVAAMGPWVRGLISGKPPIPGSHRSWGGWPLLLGMGGSFLVLVGILYAIHTRAQVRAALNSVGEHAGRILAQTGVSATHVPAPGTPGLHTYGLILVSFGLSFVFYIAVWLFRRWFSPAVAFLFLVKLCVVFYALVTYGLTTPWGSFSVLLVLGLLALFLLGSSAKYKVRLPHFARFYPKPRSAFQELIASWKKDGPDDTDPRIDLEKYKTEHEQCAEQEREAEEDSSGPRVPRLRNGEELGHNWRGRPKAPVAVVCVSGGGIRAAAWTTAVLARLEVEFAEMGVCLPHHILLVTGASGGMVGASAYTATIDPPGSERPPAERQDLLDQLAENMAAQDFLSPVVYRMIYHDLLRAFVPGPLDRDRGWALERAWSEKLRLAGGQVSPLDRTFADLYQGEAEGWRPHLIFSPMIVEDGRQLLISNLDLTSMVENRGNLLDRSGATHKTLSREALEFFALFPNTEQQLRLSTAARMSASFPLVSPAIELPTRPRRRVVDAGYYDNFGVNLAAAWLFHYRQWLCANASGVVVIQIRDNLTEGDRRMDHIGKDQSGWFGRSMEGLTGVIEAVMSAREAAAGFRNDDRLAALSEHFLQDGTVDKDFFTSVVFEFRYPREEVSLSWCLMKDEKSKIEEDAERLAESKKLKALCEWWKARQGV